LLGDGKSGINLVSSRYTFVKQGPYFEGIIWPDGFDPEAAGAILVDSYGYPIEDWDEE
jgi:hypothetical protein